MNLEMLIQKNRDLFDDREPDSGHQRRFRKKMEWKPGYATGGFLRIAAVFLLGFILTAGSYLYFYRMTEKSVVSELPPDVKETLYYYNHLSGEMIREIRELPVTDRKAREKLLDDVKMDDQDYGRLMSDLKKYPKDQRVINAIIEYHRSRAEFLEFVVSQLERGERDEPDIF